MDIISYPISDMKISTICLLAVTMIGLSATGLRAEEPERLASAPEAIVVPVDFAADRHEVMASADDKSATTVENSVIYVDDNNRLVGLSN
jgi:hypothetical protein